MTGQDVDIEYSLEQSCPTYFRLGGLYRLVIMRQLELRLWLSRYDEFAVFIVWGEDPEMSTDSEGIRIAARELEELGRRRKILTEQLEQLKSVEDFGDGADEAIEDLKGRLEAFRRGWKKAPPMTKKSLLNALAWGIVVTKEGLSIEFRLKPGLNSTGFLDPASAAVKTTAPVIDLASRRRTTSLVGDAAADIANGGIGKLQVVGSGAPKLTTYGTQSFKQANAPEPQVRPRHDERRL